MPGPFNGSPSAVTQAAKGDQAAAAVVSDPIETLANLRAKLDVLNGEAVASWPEAMKATVPEKKNALRGEIDALLKSDAYAAAVLASGTEALKRLVQPTRDIGSSESPFVRACRGISPAAG